MVSPSASGRTRLPLCQEGNTALSQEASSPGEDTGPGCRLDCQVPLCSHTRPLSRAASHSRLWRACEAQAGSAALSPLLAAPFLSQGLTSLLS